MSIKPTLPEIERPVADQHLLDWLGQRWPEGAHRLKANAKRQTWRLTLEDRPLLVKWYRLPRFAPWFWLQTRNPACHVQRITHQFAKAGLRTVRLGGCRTASQPVKAALLVMDWLPDAEILHNYAHDPQLESMLQAGLLDDIMRQMVLMHGLGWVHGDLKWGNILVRGQQAWFIDLDGVHRRRPGRSGYRDLARFMVDCDEAECSSELKQLALELYARHAGKSIQTIQQGIAKDYQKIQRRHQQRYDGSRNMPHWPTDKS